MKRRHFLVTLTALAGCSNRANKSSDGAGQDNSEPTVRPKTETPEIDFDVTKSLGEWHTGTDWAHRVTEVELRDEVVVTAPGNPTGEKEISGDRSLAIGWLDMKNISQSEKMAASLNPRFIASGTILDAVGSIDHPDYENGIDLDWLDTSEEHARYPTINLDGIESGETVTRWFATLVEAGQVPAYVATSTLEPGEMAATEIKWERS
jgi:hypothetical protein